MTDPSYDIRQAAIYDLPAIMDFTDFWLAGRGLRTLAPGAVNDYFISPSQHRKYITKYKTYVMIHDKSIIGWAVVQHNNTLIHLLISGLFRGKGLGSKLLKHINPFQVRSKSNQSSGNPHKFYTKNEYKQIGTVRSNSRLDIDKIRPNRTKIIEVFVRKESAQNAMAH